MLWVSLCEMAALTAQLVAWERDDDETSYQKKSTVYVYLVYALGGALQRVYVRVPIFTLYAYFYHYTHRLLLSAQSALPYSPASSITCQSLTTTLSMPRNL
ncbi:hypothetical protein F5Y16DRAFT_293850 [Xylariaceae sp. FL0255]|nr:hypothetical protein F5Y16DRAFT_293850 [Xylariaceae sp. FL0255]